MIYRAIGLMSGSSLDGLDIVYAEFHENGGQWTYEIIYADCYAYTKDWIEKLQGATSLKALDYQLLHTEYGQYLGAEVNRFIEQYQLQYKVALVGSHGHTTFHVPAKKMTAQLGDGAAIAATTKLPVVTDLRAMDLALGGEGAPIVPIGEKLLFGNYDYFLNIGGIANISFNGGGSGYIAFDVCAANRVLNMLSQELGREYDEGGKIASTGQVNESLLKSLDSLSYYGESWPKSLANDFGTDIVYPMIQASNSGTADRLRTYTEHVAIQIARSVEKLNALKDAEGGRTLLVTGGGAFNTFLVERLGSLLSEKNISVVVPDNKLVQYKEALIMALIAVLRWREEINVFSSVTGASRDSIGGALWNGHES